MTPTTRLELRLIGGFALRADGAPVDLRNRKGQALLALLALAAPAAVARERLAAALWSTSDEGQARQSLRQTLHDIRRALGPAADSLLIVSRAGVGLAAGRFSVDILDLAATVATADAPPATIDWRALDDAILAGFDDIDEAFSAWLVARRRALLERLTEALERRLAAARGDEVRRWAAPLAALDPTHEPACRAMMESDAARGDVRAALRRYGELWRLLDEEFAVEPSPETQALAVRLKSLEGEPAAEPAARPSLTLSIGEFRLDGVPEAFGYLVRGFRQDLIASLTPYREWVVVEAPPGSLRGDGFYALEAFAFPTREGVRINVTLKEIATARFVWSSQDIALDLESWFESCRLTTRRIAAALDVRVSGDRLERQRGRPDPALPLYDRLLMARDLMARWRPDDDLRAEAILREILRRDPGFARAQVGMAQLLNARHIVFPGAPRAAGTEALGLARAAAALDPLDAEAQLCLGWCAAMQGDAAEAVAALRTACELNPTRPATLASAANAFVFCGERETALRMAEESLALDFGASPMNWAYRVSVYLFTGRFREAIEAVDRACDATWLGEGDRIVALASLGDVAAARARWPAYVDAIAAAWRGRTPPDAAAVADWYLAAQPVCGDADRRWLRASLAAAGAPVG